MWDFESKVQVSQIYSSLSAQKYSSLTDVQKIITPRTIIVSGRVNDHWKDKKLVYIFYI
jgi:hypothetical protein